MCMCVRACIHCTVALENAWSFVITTECLQLMIESHTSPTLPHPIPSLSRNSVPAVISSGAQQTTSSHTAAITETTSADETNTSQQNGTVSYYVKYCTYNVYTLQCCV